ncbi:MAG TPA: M15 family metallopeptidase [Trueperaceae bacterium]
MRLSIVLGLLTLFVTAVAAPPPCEYADLPALTPSGEWRHLLVDTAYRLPAQFVPPDLVPVRNAGLADDRPLTAAAVADLADLVAAAAAEGIHFELQSAYRSFDYQQRVFAGWVETLGRERALLTSARPGHSEHQLGTALDLRSAGGPAPWDLDDWAETREGGWLAENAWRFGFLMSYPEGETEVTCYAYEPWHYRWVGRPTAAAVEASGLTLREWLWERLEEADEKP